MDFMDLTLVERTLLLQRRCERMIDGSVESDELLAIHLGDHYATACHRIAELRALGLEASPMIVVKDYGMSFDFSIRVRVGEKVERVG